MITLPLIVPILVWGAVALVGIFSAAGIAGAFKDPKKNKLGVLGMQGAGKTRFLCYLRGVTFKETSTGREPYNEFKYRLNNNKEIIIMHGTDMGGGNVYRADYNEVMEKSDVVLFFFDIDRYLRNELDPDNILYRRSCNSRFQHIYSEIKTHNKPILIIATHKDKCGFPEKDIKQKFDSLIQNENKAYKEMLKSIEYVNLTNEWDTKRLANVIFNNK